MANIMRATVFVLVGLLCLAAGNTMAGEPLKIRIGYGEAPATITPLLFLKKDILRHHGKSYVADPIYFRGTTATLQALGAKELDLAYMAPGGLAHAVLNARLDLKVVSDLAQWGTAGYHGPVYMVLEDSGIRTAADLKGKILAVNALGTGVHLALTAMMKKVGLKEKTDYTVVEVRFPAMEATLREKKVDLISAIPPFYYQARAKGGVRDLFTSRDAMGPVAALFNVARAEFLQAHRAAVVDFFEDYVRAQRWFLDPANRAEALQITAGFLKRPVSVFEGWAFTPKDYYRDPGAMPDLETLQRNIEQSVEVGAIPRRIEVKEFADLSFLEEARKRLP
jgi:NitT/TauT family transport system substrate-binding protein